MDIFMSVSRSFKNIAEEAKGGTSSRQSGVGTIKQDKMSIGTS